MAPIRKGFSGNESSETKKAKLGHKKKELIFNAFLMGSAGCQTMGIWRHPNDKSRQLYSHPDYWFELARLLEKGKFNAVFFADVLGPYDVYRGPQNEGPVAKAGSQFPVSDPTYFIPLMAAVTKHLSFGVTMSTISEEPYHLARRLGTLDLISNGRVGWNIVTSYLDSAARNLLNGRSLPDNKNRYERAEEYVDVVYKLFLSSWQDGSLKLDRDKGIFTDPNGLRHINHEGKHFKVPGPAFTQPSPQKIPVIIQAGTSTRGKELAARNAEVVFLGSLTPEASVGSVVEIKKIAKEKYRRDPSKIKFLALVNVILGNTHEEAERKYQEYKSYGDDEDAKAMFSGWTGVDIDKFSDDEVLTDVDHVATASAVKKWQSAYPRVEKWTKKAIIDEIKISGYGSVAIGTPEEVASIFQRWIDIADIDGFNLAYTLMPQCYEEIINELFPVLRRHGLAREDYPETSNKNGILTFREQLSGENFLDESHPAYELNWGPNETRQEYEERLPGALKGLEGQ